MPLRIAVMTPFQLEIGHCNYSYHKTEPDGGPGLLSSQSQVLELNSMSLNNVQM